LNLNLKLRTQNPLFFKHKQGHKTSPQSAIACIMKDTKEDYKVFTFKRQKVLKINFRSVLRDSPKAIETIFHNETKKKKIYGHDIKNSVVNSFFSDNELQQFSSEPFYGIVNSAIKKSKFFTANYA
jgi:hypothetical protein